MDFELGNAVAAGLAATSVMTAMLYMGFAMGMKMDMPRCWARCSFPRDQRPGCWA